MASPIILAATSLCVYAWQHGTLLPSVAFTAIAIFNGLEVALAIIPELTTDTINAKVSIDRIEKYLNLPEVTVNTENSENISFEKAAIAWPSDDDRLREERYVLRDLNITFPNGELTVISGKTGTGKSLLLSAILGEVDVLGGKVKVPRPPRPLERRDHLANKDNWIIASSIAFVAQIPWIENASIKENILFGLPLDKVRYQRVLEACAMTRDIATFIDGEDTEIGANGINLSGGQKWRLSFARALYSRAGILVLDDIFSAVDAHVGRHIYEQGLIGELGTGRTRVLVTHHVGLCKSRASYIVELGEGTVRACGKTNELEERVDLEQIISHEDVVDDEPTESEESTAVASEVSSNGESSDGIKKITPKIQGPRKFVEDEWRQSGRVKTSVYKQFFSSFGGLGFWAFALSMQIVTLAFTLGESIILYR